MDAMSPTKSTVGPQEKPMNEEAVPCTGEASLIDGDECRIDRPGDDVTLEDWNNAENAKPCEWDSSYSDA